MVKIAGKQDFVNILDIKLLIEMLIRSKDFYKKVSFENSFKVH